jgi:hypothetical protein
MEVVELKIMKTCKVEGCNNPIWSNGACKFHAPKTHLKNRANMLLMENRKPFPNPSAKSLKKIEEDFLNIKKRDEFFMGIWIDRMHRCEICGIPLGHEPRSYMFDHLLEKSKYPDLKFEPLNIALVCLACHDNKTRGIINAKYQEKINFVITKFNVS